MTSDIEKNKQMSEIKIEPEELCGSNFIQTKETEITCNTSTGKFYTKSKTIILLELRFILTVNEVSDLWSINNAHIELT